MNNLKIHEIFIPQTSISIAEQIDVQIDDLGNNIIQMYQVIGIINDGKAPVSESLLDYINENLLQRWPSHE